MQCYLSLLTLVETVRTWECYISLNVVKHAIMTLFIQVIQLFFKPKPDETKECFYQLVIAMLKLFSVEMFINVLKTRILIYILMKIYCVTTFIVT